MATLFRQPLLHFLLLGGILFAVYPYVSTDGDVSSAREIRIDREDLLTYIQYRAKAFDRDQAERRYTSLTGGQRQQLVESLIREEALYRQALEFGLDRNDYVIKQRLIQKLEYIAEGLVATEASLSDAAINDYFEKHRTEYRILPQATFTHVFFDRESRGEHGAKRQAELALVQLNAEQEAFSAANRYGDRFLYQRNYVDKEPDLVAAHFGKEMAATLFVTEPGGRWFGPVASPHGYHLVMLSRRTQEVIPALSEIYDQVVVDARRARHVERVDDVIDEFVSGFEVRVNLTPDLGAEPSQAGEQSQHKSPAVATVQISGRE